MSNVHSTVVKGMKKYIDGRLVKKNIRYRDGNLILSVFVGYNLKILHIQCLKG